MRHAGLGLDTLANTSLIQPCEKKPDATLSALDACTSFDTPVTFALLLPDPVTVVSAVLDSEEVAKTLSSDFGSELSE